MCRCRCVGAGVGVGVCRCRCVGAGVGAGKLGLWTGRRISQKIEGWDAASLITIDVGRAEFAIPYHPD